MIKVAILDDSPKDIEKLLKVIRKVGCAKELTFECFMKGSDLIKYFMHNNNTAIILMDICLDNNDKTKDGIFLAKRIRKLNHNVLIIFISGHKEFFPRLVNAEPFRFVDKEHIADIKEALDAAVYRIREIKGRQKFIFRCGYEQRSIYLSDIIYFQSSYRRILIISIGSSEEQYFYDKLPDLEKRLRLISNKFVRINRSYIINSDYILEYKEQSVVMVDGKIISCTEMYRDINLSNFKS